MSAMIETWLSKVLLAPTRSRLGWSSPLDQSRETEETPGIPGVFVSPCPVLPHQSRAGNAASLLCQLLKGISRGQEHKVAGTDPNQETAGICFLSKHHPRVLLDSSPQMIKKQLNLHQLFLELAHTDQPKCSSPEDQAGKRC